MTRNEFLFEHDVIGISEMLRQVTKGNEDDPNNNVTDLGEIPASNIL